MARSRLQESRSQVRQDLRTRASNAETNEEGGLRTTVLMAAGVLGGSYFANLGQILSNTEDSIVGGVISAAVAAALLAATSVTSGLTASLAWWGALGAGLNGLTTAVFGLLL